MADQTSTFIDVHEIFSSIQGEGFKAGTPMTFIRLWGCNLQCPFCDTPQALEDRHETTVQALTAAAYALNNKWVCITGGEPTIHEALDGLVASLQAVGLKVAIETNGTQVIWATPDWICVSPKAGSPRNVLERADEIKILVGSGLYDAGEFVEAHSRFIPRICLQPVWSTYKYVTDQNTERALELCHKHQVRLSIQLHKYIGAR